MDNFDLRKYLAENKLTNQSKLISEEFLFINSDGDKVYKDEKVYIISMTIKVRNFIITPIIHQQKCQIKN